jgi:uncharacterized membrane protein YebE (DUF533 family)
MDVNSLFNTLMGQTGAGIDRAVETAKTSSISPGLVGGVAAGGLAALLLTSKKSRKIGKKAIKYGGAAALGGLAYKAWSDYKGGRSGQSVAPADTRAVPQPPRGSIFDLGAGPKSSFGEDMRLSLIRAMISAAKADGHIDGAEQARIEAHIDTLQLDADERQFLVEQLRADSDPIAIARLSNTDEQAAELYLASALAVDPDTAEEKRYLDRLSDALRLPGELRARLDAEAAAI